MPILGRGSSRRLRPARRALLARVAGLCAISAALLPGLGGSARAQDYQGARLIGLGGARRALGTANEAFFSNPAGLAAAPIYEIELGYADDFRDADRRVNLAIADGQAGSVAGGIAVTYGRFRPTEEVEGDRRLEGLRVDVATAVPLTKGIFLGGGARYSDYRLLEGDDEIEDGGSNAFTFDVGLLWQIGEGFSLGATLQNLTDAPQPGIPRAWGAGLGWRKEAFTIEVDVEHAWERTDPVYTGALGYVLGEKVPVRAAIGYAQETEELILSVGTGLQIERVGIDVAYRQILDPRGEGADADERLFVGSLRLLVF